MGGPRRRVVDAIAQSTAHVDWVELRFMTTVMPISIPDRILPGFLFLFFNIHGQLLSLLMI